MNTNMFISINRIYITNFIMISDNCFHLSLPASFTYMLYNKEEFYRSTQKIIC